MCTKLCMICAASGIQGCLLLAATLRSVIEPGATLASGQVATRAASVALAGVVAPEEHIAELRAGRGAPDAQHQATKPRGR